MAEVEEKILRYKKHLDKYLDREIDTDTLRSLFRKLDRLDVSLEHLQTTRIGKAVNNYRKHEGEIGEDARALISKWKTLVPAVVCETETPKTATTEVSVEREDSPPDPRRVPYMKPSKVQVYRDSVDSYEGSDSAPCDSKIVCDKNDYHPSKHCDNKMLNKHHSQKHHDSDRKKTSSSHGKESKHNKKVESSRSSSKHGMKRKEDDRKNHDSSSSKSKHSSKHRDADRSRSSKPRKDPSPEKSDNDVLPDIEESMDTTDFNGVGSPNEAEPVDANNTSVSKKRKSEQQAGHSSHKKSKSEKPVAPSKPEQNEGPSFDDLMQFDALLMKKHSKKKPSSHSPMSSSVKKDGRKTSSSPKPSSSSSKSSHRSSDSKSQDKHKSSKHHKSSHRSSESKNVHKQKVTPESSADEILDVPVPSKEVKLSTTDILGTLPDITPNYRPLPQVTPREAIKPQVTDDSLVFSKNTRTAVYAGRKNTTYLSSVPSLFDSCVRVLIDNIDNLEHVGGIPCQVLMPVLEKCSASQLYTLEEYNPHFIGDSEELWKRNAHKDFKGHSPGEFESWRELYLRMHDEREAKLKKVAANISVSMAKKTEPVRSTKLAYVDSSAKPPRGVRRQQMRHGTAGPMGKQDPLNKLSSHSGSSKQPKAPFATRPVMDSSSQPRKGGHKQAKVIAPMMQKAKRMMKKYR